MAEAERSAFSIVGLEMVEDDHTPSHVETEPHGGRFGTVGTLALAGHDSADATERHAPAT
jgi:hypothetical protein